MPTIGWLFLGSESSGRLSVEAFRTGLADFGYTEGANVRVLYRYADGSADRLPALAAELVSLGAMVIVTAGGTAIQAVHKATLNVPVVSWVSPDPVMMGWAQNLARPGGMITGLFFFRRKRQTVRTAEGGAAASNRVWLSGQRRKSCDSVLPEVSK
jgi:putative ABC transport system substrate-binding protein